MRTRKIIVAALAAGLFGFAQSADAKTLKLALSGDLVSLDPHVHLSAETLQYSHWVFDPLVRLRQDMQLEPRLALRWERINDRTMRFFLRDAVVFHSGNPFTGEDVRWTVERLKKSVDFKGLFEPLEEVKVIDDYTIDIITKKPYALLLNMATYIFPMDRKFYSGVDDTGRYKDAIVKIGPSFALTHESGTGPFKVTYRDPGVRTVLERSFGGHWDRSSAGNVTKVIVTPIEEDATRVAALLSGDVDFISPIPPQDFQRLRRDKNVKLVTIAGGRIITFQLNQKRRPELADPRVRRAIVYAINNPGIVKKIMEGTATAAGQQSPAGYAGHNPDLRPRYDLKRAHQLMKDAGLEKGFTATMIAPNNRYVNDEKIAEAVAAMLAKINIKVNLKTMPKARYWDEFDAQAADIQMIGWHSDTEDSGNFSEFLVMCPDKKTGYGHYNSGNYCNPRIDELTLAAQSETNLTRRADILKEIEKILYDDAAFVPLHWQNHSYGAKKNVMVEPIVNTMNFPYIGDLVIK
ncbi:ABC transporter, substrate-binding protein (cluster 5, nickel/peptides/opines) [Olavius algarvensis associated proteobacterium Delta 3]|nr:ABC transporter, substrate-binding protein (cluster 5, nickel/peptides/opines) [Olavius algarvensis associated proteobacterium Delta 3]